MTDTTNHRYKGIHKLTEEMGELGQVIGKLNVFPDGNHPDGGPPLRDRLADELADVHAAMVYLIETNQIAVDPKRVEDKLAKFRAWGLTGIL